MTKSTKTKDMKFIDNLKELNACEEALEWADGKTWEECYNTCARGDWLAWLFEKLHPGDKRRYIIAGRCALTVEHLMKDESIAACDTVIKYGRGEASEEDLRAAREAAWAAAWAAAAAAGAAWAAWVAGAAAAAGDAGDAARAAAWATRDAAWEAARATAGDAAWAAWVAARAARAETYKQCADIIRQELPIESWNV